MNTEIAPEPTPILSPTKNIEYCQRRSEQKLSRQRYQSMSTETKREIYLLEMSQCLEREYMKCIQTVNESSLRLSPIEVCEPLVKEYIRIDRY